MSLASYKATLSTFLVPFVGSHSHNDDARFAKIRASHLHQNTKNNLSRFCGQNDGYVRLNSHRCSTNLGEDLT